MGECIDCKSTNITYLDTEITDNQLGYEYHCDDCDSNGIEWYELNYAETISLREEN